MSYFDAGSLMNPTVAAAFLLSQQALKHPVVERRARLECHCSSHRPQSPAVTRQHDDSEGLSDPLLQRLVSTQPIEEYVF